MQFFLFGVILSIGLLIPELSTASEDPERSGERIGRWCDTAIPSMPDQDYIIEIWKSSDGSYSYHQLFKQEGTAAPSVNSYPATKTNKTWQIQSGFGEYARIGDDGFLRLYDGMGLIRKAKPVGPTTKPGACRPK